MKQTIGRQLQAAADVVRAVQQDDALLAALERAILAAVQAYRGRHKLLLAGNGGSAADAQHMAGELVNRFLFDRPALPAVALSTDTSVLTAIGNDSGFEHVFARQIEALGEAGDLFIGLTTSGRSPNILRAFEACRRKKLVTVAMTGQGGADLAAHCDICLVAPSRETPRIQEVHAILIHLFCGLVEETLFGRARDA